MESRGFCKAFFVRSGAVDRDGSGSSTVMGQNGGTDTLRKLRIEIYHLRARMTAYLKVLRLTEKGS